MAKQQPASIDVRLMSAVAKLTKNVSAILRAHDNLSYPATVCAHEAIRIAVQQGNPNPDALPAFVARHRPEIQGTLCNMIAGRHALTDACRRAAAEKPAAVAAVAVIRRARAISDGLLAKLCGYDAAIIYLHAFYGADPSYWLTIETPLTPNGRDDVLARWEQYVEAPLVSGMEDATPLRYPE